jgi:guanine deaminase
MNKILRGQVVSFDEDRVLHIEKGAVAVDAAGRIAWVGEFEKRPELYRDAMIDDHGDQLILPGFVDAHIHFPQYRMLAAPGKDLLDWLQRFTFPEESKYADSDHAATAAEIFLNRLISHGTTSALAFSSVHKTCADELFRVAAERNMALITGKTMMDRNAIPAVQDTAEQGARESEALYKSWHNKGRLRYAVTPRFAITSSEAQLKASGELMNSLPDALMQTHISESHREIDMVRALFPNARDYTDVYETFGLLGSRSLFAHGIHLSAREKARFVETESTVVHCPTSNTFLGSGLMAMQQMHDIALGLATDIGGGTSYSMLATIAEAYRVQMLTGYKPPIVDLYRLATLGNAQRLHLENEIGSLAIGKWADIIVLNPEATSILKARHALSQSLEDILFSLALLGDDRAVSATYVAGRKVHDRRDTEASN